MQYQMTIADSVTYSGVGLHSGKQVSLMLRPAPENTGIVFVRTDIEGQPEIPAQAKSVTAALRATTLSAGEIKVFTIEHVMSAIHAWQIDNCYVEMDAEEPPVADGSSMVFFDLIGKVGLKQQTAAKKVITITEPLYIRQNEKFITILPYDGFRVSFTSINEHKMVGIQYADYEITPESYRREISPARTIAYEQEVEALHKMGLGLGGTLENVIVYNDERWLTKLRYEDELVRHKILDIIGDLRLSGGSIRGHVIAVKSGHALNTAFAKKLAEYFEEHREELI